MILGDTCTNLPLPEKLIGKGLHTNLEGIWTVKGIQSPVSRGDRRNLTYLASQSKARIALVQKYLRVSGKTEEYHLSNFENQRLSCH